jgi:hypothetical protein
MRHTQHHSDIQQVWSDMSRELAGKLEILSIPGPDPQAEEIARQKALDAAKEELGEDYSQHVQHGIEIALGTYATTLIRLEERGES